MLFYQLEAYCESFGDKIFRAAKDSVDTAFIPLAVQDEVKNAYVVDR